MHDEFLEGDFEVAIKEDQRDTVLGVEVQASDHVECRDSFNEADGPWLILEGCLVAGLEVFDFPSWTS